MKQELCKLADIPASGTLLVPFFGRELHVFRRGEQVRAVANTCLHFGGPLSCEDKELVCAWHGARFSLDSGKRVSGPAPKDSRLMTISTRVEGDALFYVWEE